MKNTRDLVATTADESGPPLRKVWVRDKLNILRRLVWMLQTTFCWTLWDRHLVDDVIILCRDVGHFPGGEAEPMSPVARHVNLVDWKHGGRLERPENEPV